MKSMRFALPLVLVVAALAACGGKAAPLEAPLPLQAAREVSATEQAIHQALVQRGFVVQGRQPGVVNAIYVARRHKVWVEVRYDQRAVQIYYIGSEGLNESRAGNSVMVHRKVNAWLANLQSDLANALARAAYTPASPPPPQPYGAPPPPAPYPPPAQYPPPQPPPGAR